MSKPFFTILIPTRERCETLISAIKTCTSQCYDDFEIIVSDNHSTDDTRRLVLELSDTRIRYVNTGRRVSMTSNFEFALKHARPGYVTSIGDDDGLMPRALADAAEIISKTGAESIASSAAYYFWPSYPVEAQRNILRIKDIRPGMHVVDSRIAAARRLSFRGEEPEYVKGLPSLYHGFISTDLIERAKSEGRYFHSAAPDAYSALVNSLLSERFAYSRRPLILAGISGKSNGASQLAPKVGENEESRYLAENDIAIHRSIRYAPSVSLILAEAFLQVRDRFPEAVAGIDFSLARACGAALADKQLAQQDRVRSAVKEIARINDLVPATPSFASTLGHLFRRAREGFDMFETRFDERSVQDVYQASVIACDYLDSGHKPSIFRSIKSIASHATRKLRQRARTLL